MINLEKSRQLILAGVVATALILMAGPAMSADSIDPEADKILQSMSIYLGGLPSFSVKADVDNEYIDIAGQKLQLSSTATIIMERPGKLFMQRLGAYAAAEIIFDGKVLSLHGKDKNVYMQDDSPENIDDVFNVLNDNIGLDTPGGDLFMANAYPRLAGAITSSSYLGTAYVDGIECHYMAFRSAKFDWQLWVRTDKTPLPMKYIITTKWVTSAPQYSLRFREWDTNPQIDPNQFAFTVPEGARKIDSLPVNEVGELMVGEDLK